MNQKSKEIQEIENYIEQALWSFEMQGQVDMPLVHGVPSGQAGENTAWRATGPPVAEHRA